MTVAPTSAPSPSSSPLSTPAAPPAEPHASANPDFDWLSYHDGTLHAESLSLPELAKRHGTPLYVYSRPRILRAWSEFAQATSGRRTLICYAMKANDSLAILATLARAGAGFDIVSGGELERVLAAGGRADKVLFSGVGKSRVELERALRAGVRCFNVESFSELRRLSGIAESMSLRAPVSLRINPDVDPGTHPYISTGLRENKFGIPHDQARAAYREAGMLPGIEVVGIDCHIGSMIERVEPYLAALDRLLELIDNLAADGIALRHIDLGGGLGIRYRDETPPSRAELIGAIFERLQAHPIGRTLEVMFEFGRAMVGNAGLLLTRVEYLKENADKRFAIVDAAMTELIRPSLYDAWHDVWPVTQRHEAAPAAWDIVGPVCESGDWLARARPLALREGDLLAILSAGAYARVMSSNYNTRPRAAEVMIDGSRSWLIRERESISDLMRGERLIEERPIEAN